MNLDSKEKIWSKDNNRDCHHANIKIRELHEVNKKIKSPTEKYKDCVLEYSKFRGQKGEEGYQ